VSCSCQIPELDLFISAGTSPSWPVVLVNPETADSRADLTGASLIFLVKESSADADSDAVFSLTSADGEIVILDAEDGFCQIDNTLEKLTLLELGRWYWFYFRVTLASGEIRPARNGRIMRN